MNQGNENTQTLTALKGTVHKSSHARVYKHSLSVDTAHGIYPVITNTHTHCREVDITLGPVASLAGTHYITSHHYCHISEAFLADALFPFVRKA